MNIAQLKECSRVLKAETPRIRVRTVDAFPSLTPMERQTLYWADRMGLKLLRQKNF